MGAAQTLRKKEHAVAELVLQTHLEVTGEHLLLHYHVENRAERDAYLLNRVHDQSLQTDPNLVYISLDREHRIVKASKKIPNIPAGMNPTMPAAPYVTALRSGQSMHEAVQIPLPVREFSAYAALPEEGQTVTYRGLVFALGYYWSTPGMKERTEQIIPGVEVLIPTPPPAIQIEFGELMSDLMAADFKVIETTS